MQDGGKVVTATMATMMKTTAMVVEERER